MALKLFAGRSSLDLGKAIAAYLNQELGPITIRNFSDGEIYVRYDENIRGEDVFIIQSTQPPAENLVELLLMLDAAKRASARRVTAVIPYYGYARQDRKDQPRVPISAKLVADVIQAAGADRILTMDLHSSQIQGYFNIPFDHLYARRVLIPRLQELKLKNPTVLAPDIGSVPLARSYAKLLGATLAMIDKRRPAPNRAEVMNLIGEVKNREVLIMDDMVDTAGTLVAAAETALEHGARSVMAACTHGVFSGPAVQRLHQAPITKMLVTDTLPMPASKRFPQLEIVSSAPLFGEAIRRIHNEESISILFNLE